MNAPGLILGRGADKLGVKWCSTPIATVSAPRGKSPPCVYRGWCHYGCSTNAKQSALVVWATRAVAAGAEIRDMAMVGQVETNAEGTRVTGVRYQREGEWRVQKARNVVVAGYAIETPRLLLNSATSKHPDGLANSSGCVGAYLTTHAGPGVWATFDEDIRWNKGPPNMAVTEHWNYTDEGKDFHGGYAFMSQGPLAREWGQTLAGRGLWGAELQREMAKYNHTAGFVPVAEVEPRACNTVTLADEVDQYGLKIPKLSFSYSDNDRRLQAHSKRFMGQMLEAAGGYDLWDNDDTSHLMGTCRMGDDPKTSVVNADGRSWDVPNLWVCDGSLFATTGAVNPSPDDPGAGAPHRRPDRGVGQARRAVRERSSSPPLRSGGGGPCEAWWRGRSRRCLIKPGCRSGGDALSVTARSAPRHLPSCAGEEIIPETRP